MLLVLPPSETKRDGGADASKLDLSALAFPQLGAQRRAALAALRTVSRNRATASAALGLGPTQAFEIDRNRSIGSSAVMPALDRYTGVLYDGLQVQTLGEAERAFASEHLVIHSALFGLVRAGDLIPAYRLSHDSRLPGLSLRTHWKKPISTVLDAYPGLVLDLRSESYASLGPARTATYVRVVSDNGSGRRVALSHFNKKAKGEFTRAMIAAGLDHGTLESLVEWAEDAGIRLEAGKTGEVDLVV